MHNYREKGSRTYGPAVRLGWVARHADKSKLKNETLFTEDYRKATVFV